MRDSWGIHAISVPVKHKSPLTMQQAPARGNYSVGPLLSEMGNNLRSLYMLTSESSSPKHQWVKGMAFGKLAQGTQPSNGWRTGDSFTSGQSLRPSAVSPRSQKGHC